MRLFLVMPLLAFGGTVGWYLAFALCMRLEPCEQ